MTENQSPRTNTAMEEKQTQAWLSTNRRRFLKYTALSSVVGFNDRSLMSQAVSATASTDAQSPQTPASTTRYREQDTTKTLRVTGASEGTNQYHTEIKKVIIPNEENDDPPMIDVTVIEGEVRQGETDEHRIKGRVATVHTQGSTMYSIEQS